MPPRHRTFRALALLCAALVALVACSYGGDGDEESASTSTTEKRTRETTEETVLGDVLEREVEPAAPAEPVPVPTTARATTTTRPRPTTTTAAPTTTTTVPAPRPNRLTGGYEARTGTTDVTVELYREGVLADARELSGSGTFAFDALPPGAYRVIITDRQVDGDTSSEVVSACPEVGLTDGDGASVDAAWDRDCTVLLSSP
jgi:hypothetical protein